MTRLYSNENFPLPVVEHLGEAGEYREGAVPCFRGQGHTLPARTPSATLPTENPVHGPWPATSGSQSAFNHSRRTQKPGDHLAHSTVTAMRKGALLAMAETKSKLTTSTSGFGFSQEVW